MGPGHPDFLVNAIAYREWTKRDEVATIAVLSKAGDLLDANAADHVVQRILDLLKNDEPVRVHGGAWNYRWNEADGALARVLKAASMKSHKNGRRPPRSRLRDMR